MTREPVAAPARRPTTGRADLVTAMLSAWLIFGVFLDGWAHNTRPQLESFFTPWHAVFYSGFLAVAGWVLWLAGPARRGGTSWAASLPDGYGLAVCGIVVFALSGVGDMLWHLAFGIEQNLGALLSPTHLGLFVGGLLIVTAPLRSASHAGHTAEGWRPMLPPALSLALAGSLTAFLLQPFHPIAFSFVSRARATFLAERYPGSLLVANQSVLTGLAGFILGTALLLGPVVLLLRRWRPPVGMIAGMLVLQCLLIQGMRGFRDPALLAFGALGALAVEGLAALLRPRPGDLRRLRAFCALAPPLFWGVYLAGIAVRDHGLGWSPEFWGGALVWTSLTLLGPTVVMDRASSPPAR